MAFLWPFEVKTHSAPDEALPLCGVQFSAGNKGCKKEETQL